MVSWHLMTNVVPLNLTFKCACTVYIVVEVIITPEIQHELGYSEVPEAVLGSSHLAPSQHGSGLLQSQLEHFSQQMTSRS